MIFRTVCPACHTPITLQGTFVNQAGVFGTTPDHQADGRPCPESGIQRHRPELQEKAKPEEVSG